MLRGGEFFSHPNQLTPSMLAPSHATCCVSNYMKYASPGDLLFKAAFDGFEVRAAKSLRPGNTIFEHYEEVHRVFITLEGGTRSTVAEIDGDATILRPDQPGAVTVVPAGTRRRVLLEDTDFVIFNIGFTDEFLRASLADDPEELAGDWRPPLVQNIVNPWLMRAGMAFKSAGMQGAPAMQIETFALLIARHIAAPGRHNGRGGGLDPLALSRVIQLMQDRIADDLTLAELAAEAGLGVSAFGRAFAKSLGLSPFRFFTVLRMKRAQELLAYTGKPLAEIAGESGYADQAHFTAAFTRHAGISPGRWRAEFGTGPNFMPISRKTPSRAAT